MTSTSGTCRRIMDLTKVGLGMQPGTIQDALVNEKIEDEKPGILDELALIVLEYRGAAAGRTYLRVSLAVPAPSTSAWRPSTSRNTSWRRPCTGSALDQARALSQEDPSLFWLAVEIVGVGLGDVPAVATAAFRTYRVLAPVARAALIAEEGKGCELGPRRSTSHRRGSARITLSLPQPRRTRG